jgi:hypothetical protein
MLKGFHISRAIRTSALLNRVTAFTTFTTIAAVTALDGMKYLVRPEQFIFQTARP